MFEETSLRTARSCVKSFQDASRTMHHVSISISAVPPGFSDSDPSIKLQSIQIIDIHATRIAYPS